MDFHSPRTTACHCPATGREYCIASKDVSSGVKTCRLPARSTDDPFSDNFRSAKRLWVYPKAYTIFNPRTGVADSSASPPQLFTLPAFLVIVMASGRTRVGTWALLIWV